LSNTPSHSLLSRAYKTNTGNRLDTLRNAILLTLNHRVGGSNPSQPTFERKVSLKNQPSEEIPRWLLISGSFDGQDSRD